jgi:hypothetical protein
VSPADLVLARWLLARGQGLVTRATLGDAPIWLPAWLVGLDEHFTSGPAQTCARCGGRRWRRAGLDGDVCVTCAPEAVR